MKYSTFSVFLKFITGYLNLVNGINICPPPALKNLVARKSCLNERDFHCLVLYPLGKYETVCRLPKPTEEGYYSVLDATTKYLDEIPCSSDRYQPEPSFSFQYGECLYKKSRCSEEGQVIFKDGSTTEDLACRCDYRKGYSFVIQSERRDCSCIPSKEDCTCYKKICPETYELSSDSECVEKNKSIEFNCSKLISADMDREITYMLNRTVSSAYFNNGFILPRRGDFRYAITSACIFCLIYIFVAGITISIRESTYEAELSSNEQVVKINIPESRVYKEKEDRTLETGTSSPVFKEKPELEKHYIESQEKEDSTHKTETPQPVLGERQDLEEDILGSSIHVPAVFKYDVVIFCDDRDEEKAKHFSKHILDILEERKRKKLSIDIVHQIRLKNEVLQKAFDSAKFMFILVTKNLINFYLNTKNPKAISWIQSPHHSTNIALFFAEENVNLPFEVNSIEFKYNEYLKSQGTERENDQFLELLKKLFKI